MIWDGPYDEGTEECGVTASLLSKFIICRHRFLLQVREGFRHEAGWPKAIYYGNLWHAAFENEDLKKTDELRVDHLVKWPSASPQIEMWYEIFTRQWRAYHAHYGKQAMPDEPEVEFRVPYQLSSGRTILLRGKRDGYLKRNRKEFLIEHKVRERANPADLMLGLQFDLQTMLYCLSSELEERPVYGIIYNLCRRPALRLKKSESVMDFVDRIEADIETRTEHYFRRVIQNVEQGMVSLFRTSMLSPLLEQLCDWWEWISVDPSRPYRKGNTLHWARPFGVYDPLIDGNGRGEFFEYLTTGSMSGIVEYDTCFPELQGEQQDVGT